VTAAAESLSCVSLRIRTKPHSLLREAVDGSVRIIALLDALALPPLSLLNIDSVRTTELAMSTDAILTSKGQTTIPKKIRDALHMKAGDRISFTLMPDGVVIMRVKNKSVSKLAGLLYKKGRKPVPIEMLSR
jgi:antitoxin PrlF